MAALHGHGYRPGPAIEAIATSFPFRNRFHARGEAEPTTESNAGAIP